MEKILDPKGFANLTLAISLKIRAILRLQKVSHIKIEEPYHHFILKRKINFSRSVICTKHAEINISKSTIESAKGAKNPPLIIAIGIELQINQDWREPCMHSFFYLYWNDGRMTDFESEYEIQYDKEQLAIRIFDGTYFCFTLLFRTKRDFNYFMYRIKNLQNQILDIEEALKKI